MDIIPYRFRQFYIPSSMMPGLTRWIEDGIIPGDFLCAVLKNDLSHAVNCADDENIANLPAYVSFLYNAAPFGCWGSEEAFAAWKKKFDK